MSDDGGTAGAPAAPLIRLRPRPDTVWVSESRTVLATDLDGFVAPDSPHGLFVDKTRLLSRYRYRLDGRTPTPVTLSSVDQHTWLGYYTVSLPAEGEGAARRTSGTIALRVTRVVGDGLAEELAVTNFSQQRRSVELAVELDADFADQDEAGRERTQHGRLERVWQTAGAGAWELSFDYRAEHAWEHQGRRGVAHLHRGAIVRVSDAGSAPSYTDGALRFRLDLPPRGTWRASLAVMPSVDGRVRRPPRERPSLGGPPTERDRLRAAFLARATRFTTGATSGLAAVVERAVEQARRDLAALRLYDLDAASGWVPAAGLPTYVALFGRDSLTAAWQAALLGPDILRGALRVIGAHQAEGFDDWRDEQPGRLLHQMDPGPLAVLDFTPFARYYGAVTTPAFFPIAVSELWHWTGDRDLVQSLLGPARRAMEWLDRYGDLDGDGLYEYQTRSSKGLRNQGWKDSGEAVVHADGTLARPPIATCEEQALVYLARLRMAELMWSFLSRDDARRQYDEAQRLRARFNERLWMEDERFYAMGLDGEKRQIRSIGSDVGICLSTGIVDDERVRRTVERLFEPDLWSGWGIRTLSSRHPAYDPFAYQRGSIWPVEHGAVALAFARYGLHDAVERLCRAQFEAAALFDFCRLPEVFAGHPRDAEHPFPAVYLKANWPQAWSASSMFCLLQAMTGLYPYAPRRLLLLDPHLPAWLPELTVHGLRVGTATVTIRFHRDARGATDYEVHALEGPLHVVRQPSPWSLTATLGERFVDALASLLPGR